MGKSLALRNGEEFKIDVTPFETYTLHSYSLDHFNITAEKATAEDLARFQGTVFSELVNRIRPYYKRRVIRQRGRSFDQHIFTETRNAYLIGYWQHEKYFKDIADTIRAEITLTPEYEKELETEPLYKDILNKNSVAVHIRRGDYVSNPRTNRKFGTCSIEYYERATRHIEKTVEQPHYFVFSDDIQWAKENLAFNCPTFFVENGVGKNYIDLMLMRYCKHMITANSSFSWWGAWLNNNTEKVIVTPQQWLASNKNEMQDIAPPGWVRIE